MPSTIDDLEFFTTLVAAQTLTEAARHWGVSVSVVSRRLRALEERLGVQLAKRGSRALALTAEGEAYRARGLEILHQVRDLEMSIGNNPRQISGPLRVVSTVGLGRLHIAPLLSDFQRAHPLTECSLELTSLPLSAVRLAYDVAIHVGPVPDSSRSMRRLLPNRRLLVASPAYVAEHGTPTDLQQLRAHSCLVLRENEGDVSWRFVVHGKEVAVPVRGPLTCNDGIALTEWCLSGAGLAMRSQWHVSPFLKAGELIEVLPHIPTPQADVVAVHEPGPHVPARVHALVDHLRARLPTRIADASPLPVRQPQETSRGDRESADAGDERAAPPVP